MAHAPANRMPGCQVNLIGTYLTTGRTLPDRDSMRDALEDTLFRSSVRVSRNGGVIAGTGNRTISDLLLIEGVRD